MNTIQATEFRVGNLFRFISTDSIERVADIRTAGIKTPTINNVLIADCEPIPLNEDWLVKLGFTKERNSIDSADLFIKKDIVFVLTGEHYTVSWNSVTINLIPAKVKFVHELQNLFYCLTGTELTLTDK